MNADGLKRVIKDFFTFSKSERYGIVVLCTLLFIAIVANFLINKISGNKKSDYIKLKEAVEKWESANKSEVAGKRNFFAFNPNNISEDDLDSLTIPGNIKANIIKYRQKGGKFYDLESVRKIYGMNDSIFSLLSRYLVFDELPFKKNATIVAKKAEKQTSLTFFDPNIISKEGMDSLGFSQYQINNILKFREHGGYFDTKEDLKKIYGIDSVFYQNVEPWIDISEKENIEPLRKDEVLIVELNVADSITLIGLRGIGPYLAKRIINYRDLLGGYYNIDQLLEIYNFPGETYNLIKNKIKVDTTKIHKLSINFSEYEEFSKHPYITNDEAKNILKIRNKKGPYKTPDDIVNYKLFDQEKFQKLKPYLKIN